MLNADCYAEDSKTNCSVMRQRGRSFFHTVKLELLQSQRQHCTVSVTLTVVENVKGRICVCPACECEVTIVADPPPKKGTPTCLHRVHAPPKERTQGSEEHR